MSDIDSNQIGATFGAMDSRAIERAVIACLLQDETAFDRVSDLITENSFQNIEHKIVFNIVSELAVACQPYDVVLVAEQANKRSQSDAVGGLQGLLKMAAESVDTALARRYAEALCDRYIRSSLRHTCLDLAKMCAEPEGRSGLQLLDLADRQLTSLFGLSHEEKKQRPLSEVMVALLDQISEAAERGVELTGVSTGFREMDEMTSGLQPGSLVVLAARPSMGKTALAINIAEHVAIDQGLPVAIYSLEMSEIQLLMRSVSSRGRIPSKSLKTGKLTDQEWSRLTETVEMYMNAPVLIDDAASTLSAIRKSARTLKKSLGRLGLIVIDYLQLMSLGEKVSSSEDNRNAIIGAITRGLKLLAKELDVPILVLSQLNRGVETRADKRPLMSELRESGSIEQDADVIMFIYRDDYYNKDSKEAGIAEIIFAKQRDGPVGTVKLNFEKQYTKFSDMMNAF